MEIVHYYWFAEVISIAAVVTSVMAYRRVKFSRILREVEKIVSKYGVILVDEVANIVNISRETALKAISHIPGCILIRGDKFAVTEAKVSWIVNGIKNIVFSGKIYRIDHIGNVHTFNEQSRMFIYHSIIHFSCIIVIGILW